eukprot:535539_1
MSALFFSVVTLFSTVYSQNNRCIYTADNPNGDPFTFNLTQISGWTLEYETPQHFYYYTPCRNGLQCRQGSASFYANSIQIQPGSNLCEHYLSVDHHEQASYSFTGNSWRFEYNDGQLCAQTQQPRSMTIYYHCNDVNNNFPAFVETAQETSPCNYYMSIKSTLACVPPNEFNSQCMWKEIDTKGNYRTLDLSALQGTVIRAHWQNGYDFYYSVCSNKLHCWQGHESETMAVVDNRATGTCELNLGVWENGNVHPFVRDSHSPPHWTFHYWNGDKCSDGRQAEFRVMWFCDQDVDTYKVLDRGVRDDCDLFLNISTKLACFQQDNQKKKTKAVHQGIVMGKLLK